MEKIKSAIEIALEKVASLGELTPEEKEKIKDEDKLQSLLSEFYQDKMSAEGLWQQLRKERKPYLLNKAQLNLIESVSLKSPTSEVRKRRNGILAIESLKDHKNTSVLESQLNAIESLQQRAIKKEQEIFAQCKSKVERNPMLRLQKKQVQTDQGPVIIQTQLSIDEAIKQLPEWRQFLIEHEERVSREFFTLLDILKREIE